MKYLRVLFIACLILLPVQALAADDGYGYPIPGAYEATILGTPAPLMPTFTAKMRTRPLLLAASLTMTSYVVTASRGLVGGMPGALRLGFDAIELLLLAAGATALFRRRDLDLRRFDQTGFRRF